MAAVLTSEMRVLLAEVVRKGPVVMTLPVGEVETVLALHKLVTPKFKTGYGGMKYVELHSTEKGCESYSKALAAGLVKDPRHCERCGTTKCPDGCCCAC